MHSARHLPAPGIVAGRRERPAAGIAFRALPARLQCQYCSRIRRVVSPHNKFDASSARGERSPLDRVMWPAMAWPMNFCTMLVRPFEVAST